MQTTFAATVKGRNQTSKRILDIACGSKMFWFNKHNPDVEFCDNRTIPYHEYYPHRYIEISPDTVCDFTELPFPDESYKLVVFDPPHMLNIGDNSWMVKKYGKLNSNWKAMIKDGFDECMRVLKPNGTLVFKWNEYDIPVKDIIKVIGKEPLYGHKSGKQSKTHWMCFMKDAA